MAASRLRTPQWHGLAVGLILIAALSPAGLAQFTVSFSQSSSPAGIVPLTASQVATGTVVTGIAASVESGFWRFMYWTYNGVRYGDELGRSMNPLVFTVREPVTAIAYYQNSLTDADGDGISDWFEMSFYGVLTNAASSDTDGDGFTLQQEFNRDYHPGLRDTIADGGLSRRSSPLLLLIQNAAYAQFQIRTSPSGFADSQMAVATNTLQLLPDLAAPASGYRFGQWLVNGVRVADELGRSTGLLPVTITGTTTAVAMFYRENEDADNDGVPDWFEWNFYGTTNNAAASDTDGDGFTLKQEFDRDDNPLLVDTIVDGGISRRSTALVPVMNTSYVTFRQSSNPPGFINTQTTVLTNTLQVLTDLYGSNLGYRFGQWLVDGVRVADELGRSTGGLSVLIASNSNAMAMFYRESDDTDGDTVPDWFEWHFYGTLANGAASDTDSDGFSLKQEYTRDYHPNLVDTIADGGISRRSSSLTSIDLRQIAYYKIQSSPAGLLPLVSDYIPEGTLIQTTNAPTHTGGYTFGHWEVNAMRQQDTHGVSVNPVLLTIVTNSLLVAIYYPDSLDSNADGFPDWWEDRYYGSITNVASTADSDTDGLTNLEEYQGGSNPRVADRQVLTFNWLSGTGNWSDAVKWSRGVVPSDTPPTNCVVYIDHGNATSSVVTQNVSTTIERLILDAGEILNLLPGVALTLYRRPTGGVITNAGIIAMTDSELRIANGAGTLTGRGNITMTDSPNNLIRTTDTNAWLYNINNTIAGSGNIGSNSLGVVNGGTIIANQSTPLLLDPSDSLGFTNTGMIQVNAGSTLTIRGPGFIQTAGTTLVNGSLVAANGLNIAGGILTGNGTNVADVSNNGTLSPGVGLGRFTVTGNLTQQSNACLRVEIGGYDPDTGHDFVSVSATATLRGRLVISLTNNFAQVATNGASFTVLTASSISGAFSNVANGGSLTSADGYVRFAVQNSGSNLVLSVAQIVDGDNDGMPDWWEDLHGFFKASASDAALDADGDGLSNLGEFVAGTDPRSVSSVFKITDFRPVAGGWSVSFSALSGKLYQVQVATNLTLATHWDILQDDVPGTNGVIQILDPTATNAVQRFYRIKVKP